MKQVNLRLPDDVHERLKMLAAQERRSLNNMVIALVERAALGAGANLAGPES